MTYNHTRRMLWALMGECVLVVCVIAFNESFPSWMLKTTLLAAVLLPIIGYVTIVSQPPVYRSWLGIIRELWHAAVSFPAVLRACFSFKNLIYLARSITRLDAFPSTADAWFALLLFPLKLYVLMGLPFLRLCIWWERLTDPKVAYLAYTQVSFAFSEGYLLSLTVLLVGALFQALFSKRGRSGATVGVFLIGIMFFEMLNPWALVAR